MKKLLIIPAAVLALAACDKKSDGDALRLACGDVQVAARVSPDMIVADIKYSDAAKNVITSVINLEMPNVPAASGAKYQGAADDGATYALWNKGADWSLIINDGDMIDCAVVVE